MRSRLVSAGIIAAVVAAASGAFVATKRARDRDETERRTAPAVVLVREATGRIRAAIGKPTRAPDPRSRKALELLGRGESQPALELLRAVQADRPDDLEPVYCEALVLKEELRYAEARVLIERVLHAEPTFGKPWSTLYYYGWILLNTGDVAGARAAFTAFLEFDSNEGDAYFGLGLLDLEADDLDAAEANFKRTIALSEAGLRAGKKALAADLAKAKARLGTVMSRRGRNEEARDLVLECVALDSDSYEAWNLLHQIYKKLGDAAGAERARQRCEATRPRAGSRAPSKP